MIPSIFIIVSFIYPHFIFLVNALVATGLAATASVCISTFTVGTAGYGTGTGILAVPGSLLDVIRIIGIVVAIFKILVTAGAIFQGACSTYFPGFGSTAFFNGVIVIFSFIALFPGLASVLSGAAALTSQFIVALVGGFAAFAALKLSLGSIIVAGRMIDGFIHVVTCMNIVW